jgi:hypothetical protein
MSPEPTAGWRWSFRYRGSRTVAVCQDSAVAQLFSLGGMMKFIVIFILGTAVGFGLAYSLGLYKRSDSSHTTPPIVTRDAPNPRFSVMTSPETLLDFVRQRPNSVSFVGLAIKASSVELKDGVCLETDSIKNQKDLAEAAKKAGVPFGWE